MNKQKITLSILFIIVILTLIFIVYKSNNKIPKEINLPKPEDVVIIPTENPIIKPAEFGDLVSFKLNGSITFSDGLTVVLKEINDSRCPKGVQCIWAGEIVGTFTLLGAKLTSPKEIRLGTMRNKSVVLDGYTFSLKNATENSLSIEVFKN